MSFLQAAAQWTPGPEARNLSPRMKSPRTAVPDRRVVGPDGSALGPGPPRSFRGGSCLQLASSAGSATLWPWPLDSSSQTTQTSSRAQPGRRPVDGVVDPQILQGTPEVPSAIRADRDAHLTAGWCAWSGSENVGGLDVYEGGVDVELDALHPAGSRRCHGAPSGSVVRPYRRATGSPHRPPPERGCRPGRARPRGRRPGPWAASASR